MKPAKIFRNILLRRPSTRWLLIFSLLGWLSLAIFTFSQVRPRDFVVAARFSSLGDVVALSRWYWHYLPLAFLLIAGILNVWLAHHLLKAEESVQLRRAASQVLFFQFVLTLLTATVAYHLIRTASF